MIVFVFFLWNIQKVSDTKCRSMKQYVGGTDCKSAREYTVRTEESEMYQTVIGN